MTEAQVGFLYNIAAAISKSENDENNTLLRSYYLMRCKDITRGFGLPDKYFSTKVRCPNCCIEWNKNTEVKVKPIKLSKRQKKRLKSKQVTQNKNEAVRTRHDLLQSNEIEQICKFCRNSTTTPVLKPKTCDVKKRLEITNTPKIIETVQKTSQKQAKPVKKTIETTNVYANAMDVFSLQNNKNTLTSIIKEKPKVINNNKKKKDKFAGLCQKAVMASAKLKEEKIKENRLEQKKKENILNLFLKPSS